MELATLKVFRWEFVALGGMSDVLTAVALGEGFASVLGFKEDVCRRW